MGDDLMMHAKSQCLQVGLLDMFECVNKFHGTVYFHLFTGVYVCFWLYSPQKKPPRISNTQI